MGILNPNNSSHTALRNKLRIIGPAVFVIGLIFLLIAGISFFSSFGGNEPPRFFWCGFLGMPLMAVGAWISQFAYIGSVARYLASEAAPVAADTANYVAGETRPAFKTVAAAIAEGIREGSTARRSCAKCGAANDADARFCKACGSPLNAST